MSLQDAPLAATNHPWLTALMWTALACYGVAFLVTLLRPAEGRRVLVTGVIAHLAGTLGRGWQIGFVPFTTKGESFLGAALAMALVTALAWRPSRLYAGLLLGLTLAPMGAAFAFGLDMRWPSPLLYTVWYPLHVPLSFIAFAVWAAAAAAGLSWFRTREHAWLVQCDKLSLQAFGLWTVAMIFGGIWGVVAWGAAFLWDPKMLWSVLLWFHAAGFVHVHLTPSLSGRPWVRPALACLGLVWVLVAYVGTSFFFGKSSHAF